MDNNILDLERAIANIKADITVLERTVETLKEKDGNIEERISTSQSDIMQMKLSLNTDFNRVNQDIQLVKRDVANLNKDVTSLASCSHAIEEKVDGISNNGLLSFTSDLDLKKTLTIIFLLVSLITSPSLVSQWLFNSEGTEAEVKLDKLIELLEDAQTPPQPSP